MRVAAEAFIEFAQFTPPWIAVAMAWLLIAAVTSLLIAGRDICVYVAALIKRLVLKHLVAGGPVDDVPRPDPSGRPAPEPRLVVEVDSPLGPGTSCSCTDCACPLLIPTDSVLCMPCTRGVHQIGFGEAAV